MNKFPLILLTAVALGACSSDEPGNDVPPVKDMEWTSKTRSTNASLNKFAYDFFNASAKEYKDVFGSEDNNMTVSPLSASMALAMLANSADDDCTEKVVKALGVDDLATLNQTCNSLLRYLAWQERGEMLELANSVWYSDRFTVLPSYLTTISESFYGKVGAVDFMNSSKAVDIINSWAKSKTHGMIPKVLNDLSQQAVFVLANAMYYKGLWDEEFDAKNTKKMEFHGDKESRLVDMMHNDYDGMYYRTDDICAVSLPFARNTYMLVLCPGENVTAEELSETFDAEAWDELMSTRQDCRIHLDMPKFKVDCKADLVPVFRCLGIPYYINSLTKMGIYKEVELFSTQYTSTAIDEKGAVAAAVTVIGGYETALPPFIVNGEVTVTVDHPFLFFICDETTGTVLMAGRICNL